MKTWKGFFKKWLKCRPRVKQQLEDKHIGFFLTQHFLLLIRPLTYHFKENKTKYVIYIFILTALLIAYGFYPLKFIIEFF